LRPQYAVQVLVQKDFGKALQQLFIKFHGVKCCKIIHHFSDQILSPSPVRLVLYNSTPI
jgi:hypothetical protein